MDAIVQTPTSAWSKRREDSGRPLTVAMRVNRGLMYALISMIALLSVMPFIWLVTSSFDSKGSSTLDWPAFTFDNFTKLFTQADTPRLLVNGLIIGLGSTALTIALGTLGG